MTTIHLSDFGAKTLSSVGSISAGSNELTLQSPSGLQVGDPIIIAVGGEAGHGQRGTVGVGGVYAASADPSSYYLGTDAPKALVATITGVSSDGSVLTLDQTAQASTSGASVYFDNLPAWNRAVTSTTASGVTLDLGAGHYAMSSAMQLVWRDGWTVEGAGTTATEVFSPAGSISASLEIFQSNGVTVRDFHLHGNAGLEGYGLGAESHYASPFGINSYMTFPSGVHFTLSDNGVAENMKVTDVFQKAVGADYSNHTWARNVDVVLTQGLGSYVQWQLQWANSTGGGVVDSSITSAIFTAGFEAFHSEGTSFVRTQGVNASYSMNSSGDFLIDGATLRFTPNSVQAGSSPATPIIDINSNIVQGDPLLAEGGHIKNVTMIQDGYVAPGGKTLPGIVIGDLNPNITIEDSSYRAPDYVVGSYSAGPTGLRSHGAHTSVNHFTVVGQADNGMPNIYVSDGTVRNSTAGSIMVPGGVQVDTPNTSNGVLDLSTVAGGAAITKADAGLLTLIGSTSLAANVTVAAGTLLVDGSVVAPATVQAGATLGGHGTVGALTILNGGFLAPGNSPGTLHTGDLSLQAGAHFSEEIGGDQPARVPGSGYDQIVVTGSVSLGGAVLDVIQYAGFTPSGSQSFRIIDNDGTDAVAGVFSDASGHALTEGSTVSVSGQTLQITYVGGTGNDVVLTRMSAPVTLDTQAPLPAIDGISGSANHAHGHVVTGTLGAGDAGLVVTLSDGGTVLGTVTADAQGRFAFSFIDDKRGMSHGYDITATATDAAGNVGTSVSVHVAFDYTANRDMFGMMVYDASSHPGEVHALSQGLLGRSFGDGEAQGWVAALDGGRSLQDVTRAILQSPEGLGRINAASDADFVEQLYGIVLGRQSDPAGKQFWTNALDQGADRASIADGFVFSVEHLGRLHQASDAGGVFVPDPTDASVARLYHGLLDRAPDAAGLAGWVSLAKSGVPMSDIAHDFLQSPEYLATHAGQTDTQFVDHLYQSALGRVPDASGEQSWLNALSEGMSRAGVATGIADSLEAHQHWATAIEQGWHLA